MSISSLSNKCQDSLSQSQGCKQNLTSRIGAVGRRVTLITCLQAPRVIPHSPHNNPMSRLCYPRYTQEEAEDQRGEAIAQGHKGGKGRADSTHRQAACTHDLEFSVPTPVLANLTDPSAVSMQQGSPPCALDTFLLPQKSASLREKGTILKDKNGSSLKHE